jgi:hypothetical protein
VLFNVELILVNGYWLMVCLVVGRGCWKGLVVVVVTNTVPDVGDVINAVAIVVFIVVVAVFNVVVVVAVVCCCILLLLLL